MTDTTGFDDDLQEPESGSSLKRYLPVAAVVVVVAVIAAIFAVLASGDDDDSAAETPPASEGDAAADTEDTADGTDTSGGETAEPARAYPIIYAEAEAAGTVDDYDWGNCDTDRGQLAFPSLQAAPCVPVHVGDNGGATAPGVTEDTIRIAYYVPPVDPQARALLELSGAYDPPESIVETREAYQAIFNEVFETYGRTVELVRLDGTGLGTDATAALADAIRIVDELDVFAVINGPTQVREYAEHLAKNDVLCVGNCLIAQPEDFYAQYSDYIYGNGSSPEQAARHTIEFITKQLAGKPAAFAGDPELNEQERSFALLTYDTPDGNFASAWEKFKTELGEAGTEIDEHVSYFLDFATAQQDARTIVTRLKAAGVTSVIFSGDPIIPIYFTEEATNQDFFPEWILAGTVLVDTTVLSRPYDPLQWQNAFGYTAIQVRAPQEEQAAFRTHEWWYGTAPPSENSYAITMGAHQLLMNGIHLAGPNLTAQTFHAGLYNPTPGPSEPGGLATVVDRDDEGGYWDRPDNNGTDNASLIWWDPNVTGEDETGTEGEGMWRYVDGGRRYLPGEWPTEPMPLFDPEGTVTVYDVLPDELRPPDYPPHPSSPVGGG